MGEHSALIKQSCSKTFKFTSCKDESINILATRTYTGRRRCNDVGAKRLRSRVVAAASSLRCAALGAMADAAGQGGMGPPPSRAVASGKRVLEEDTYTEVVEAIIERDFFPELPKLQNKLEWLSALQSGA